MKRILLTLLIIAGVSVANAQIEDDQMECPLCSASITVPPTISLSPTVICPGTDVTITLTHRPSTVVQYHFQESSDDVNWSSSWERTVRLYSAMYFRMIVECPACYGSFVVQHATVLIALPPVSITGPSSICVGEITQLSPTTGGTWTSNNASVASVHAITGVVTGVSNGTATFTFTAASVGCQATTSAVTVHSPTVSITGPTSICVGATTELFPTTGGTWTSSNTSVATITNAGLVTGVSNGTATFTFTASTGCQATTQAVTVNSLPIVSITGLSTICVGSTTQLSPATGGTWTSNNTSVASVTNTGVVTGVSNGTATFTFRTNAGCQATTQAVTINPLPTISPIGTLAVHCVGENLILPTTPIVTNATTHGWEIETGDGTNEYTNLTLPHAISLANHGKRIRYRATNSCGDQHSNTATITVGDLPTISSISAPMAHCVGSLLTLPGIPIVTSAAPITNRGWQIETGFDTDDYIDFVPSDTISLADHGRRLRYRAANRCSAQFSNTVMIAVDAGPSAFTRLYDERVCRDNTLTVNFSGTGIDASKSTWTNSNPNIGLTGSGAGNLNFTAINPTDSAIFSTITVTPVSASGCSNLGLAQSFSITVYPSLNAGTIDSMGQAVALNGLADAIGNVNDAWGGDGNIEYRWRRNNTIVDGATGATHIPRTNAVGTFIYTREAKDGACNDWVSCSGEWVLTVIQASITGTDRICIGATTQLSSTIDGTWMSNNTNVASVTNEGLVTGLMEGAAAFTFTARDINFQATTALVFVSGEMLPEVNNIVAKTDLSGTPYILILPNPTGDLSFQWYHNGNPIYGATGQFFYPSDGLQEGEYKVYIYRSHLRVCGRFTASYQISLPLMSASAEWFFLYPNPSDGRFSVVFNKDIICDETTVTIGLFTLQGARITEHQVTGSERFEFDENLNNGIYVLRITTNSNLSETRQIIIQN